MLPFLTWTPGSVVGVEIDPDPSNGFAYSARIDYAVNPNWHVALDYTSRDLGNEVELDSYGLGVSYHF